MKTWKHVISGLLALALLASLSCAALAAEPKAEKAAKPTGQFSQWFPRLEQDPAAPEAVEAVLARMGTAVKQSRTVGGVTATLNGAVWDGDTLRMSLAVKAPNIPKEVAGKTNLYTEECSIALPEEDWKTYVRKDEERHCEELAEQEGRPEEDCKEGLEQSVQRFLDMGQTDYWNHVNILNFPLVSREKDTLLFEVWLSFKDYLKQPEVTLHLENIATYEDGKGDRVTWQDGKRTGPGPKDTILKGPMDFTFQLENVLPAAEYTGDVRVTADKVPFRFTGFEIGPFEVNVDYETLAPVNSIRVTKPGEAEPAPDPDKLDHQAVSKALHKVIQGLWTKDGKFVDLSQRGGGSSMVTSPDGTCDGDVGVTYAFPIDPAAVTAVKLGGTRVELAKLTAARK
ncbi:hypothetical protein [uncultured Oscillibacter sp.]|uniref:hypothetical protein n=1 Tax=uncultured Oscillibacter sp. TaxID=876091 RepID=UPI0026252169|nr:hypothetical protein [uncultured Oscillibacter sp.]